MAAFNVVLGCIMVLLIVLFKISSMARYYIKFILFIILSLIFAVAPIPLMLIKPFDPKNALAILTASVFPSTFSKPSLLFLLMDRTITRKVCGYNLQKETGSVRRRGRIATIRIPAALLRVTGRTMGLRWKVRGLENVDNTRGAVVLINHQSGLDLYVLAVLWPLMARATVVAKRALQYLAPFGTAAWLWGTVFIDRGRTSAREALNKQASAVRDDKRKLLLFPEGTRHGGDKLLPLRKGAFHVALDARAPIQPVVVSKYHFLDSERRHFGSGEVIISILPAIETQDIPKDDIAMLVDKVQAQMQEEFTRLSNETSSSVHTKAD